MIIYNMAEGRIINLNNFMDIKIAYGPDSINVLAYYHNCDYTKIISLVASSKEEKEQLTESAKDIVKSIYNAMSQDKRYFILAEDDDIGLTAVQPKTGHWRDTITAGINETVCSVCLYSGFHHFNYCPNCGAEMEGEAE